MTADLAALQTRQRARVFLQAAVGSVAVRAVEQGPGTTLAHLEVRWSARMGVVPVGTSPGTLATLPQRWILTLSRKAGVKTDQARGMATARCGNCGAPLGDSVQPVCEHCGATLNDGAHDWVLARAEPFEVWAARAPVRGWPRGRPVRREAGRDVGARRGGAAAAALHDGGDGSGGRRRWTSASGGC
jgi:hypothetical protein